MGGDCLPSATLPSTRPPDDSRGQGATVTVRNGMLNRHAATACPASWYATLSSFLAVCCGVMASLLKGTGHGSRNAQPGTIHAARAMSPTMPVTAIGGRSPCFAGRGAQMGPLGIVLPKYSSKG